VDEGVVRLVIASKNQKNLVPYLQAAGHDIKELLSNDLAVRICQETQADAILYFEDICEMMPHEDVLQDLVLQQHIRIILVVDRESPLITYAAAVGVKDFVFLPTEPATILEVIEHPGTSESAATLLRGSKTVTVATPPQEKESKELKAKGKPSIFKKVTNLLGLTPQNNISLVKNGETFQTDWLPGTPFTEKCDALVLPASLGVKAVYDARRDPYLKAVSLIVLKGELKHLHAGADFCVKKITPKVIEEATLIAKRYQDLWERVEIDPLTGLYSKQFLMDWIGVQEQKSDPFFTLTIIDLDNFKQVNDNYGHEAGDTVLATFGTFLRTNTRSCDIAARYGGEEFVIVLPGITAEGAYALIDRLRSKWGKRETTIASGAKISCTFSAGVSAYIKGTDMIAEADKCLYKAKGTGRNRVEIARGKERVLLLGITTSELVNKLNITLDPKEADIVIANIDSFKFAPENIPLVVLSTGTIADFAVKNLRPDAYIASDVQNAIEYVRSINKETTKNSDQQKIETKDDTAKQKMPEKNNLTVLAGKHVIDQGRTIPLHGALYIVCPSRPGLAGEVSAEIAKSIKNSSLICAAPESTGAIAMGISEKELICLDWRFPGSDAPVDCNGIMVWPVDPFKYLDIKESACALVEQIRRKFDLTIVDCAGKLDIVKHVTKTDGVVVLHKEGDFADTAASYWIQHYAAGNNVLIVAPAEAPNIIPADNGFVFLKKGIGKQNIRNG